MMLGQVSTHSLLYLNFTNTIRTQLISLLSLSPVEEIVKEIQDFEGLQALRLEGNTVGVDAAQAIAKALETKSEFKV